MTELKDASLEELTAELERRKAPSGSPPSPKLLPLVDWSALYKTVIDGITETIENGYMDDNFKIYIYEAALTAIYGEGYWTWRRKQPW